MVEAVCNTQDVAGGKRDKGQYDGRNISGARMWLEVAETEECMYGGGSV